MDDNDKIIRVQTLLDNDAEATSALVGVYLALAKEAILNRVYPFRVENEQSPTAMPVKYDNLQCMLAQRYFLRRGAEGEITHSENGVNRVYESVNDEDLLSQVVQIVKVV